MESPTGIMTKQGNIPISALIYDILESSMFFTECVSMALLILSRITLQKTLLGMERGFLSWGS